MDRIDARARPWRRSIWTIEDESARHAGHAGAAAGGGHFRVVIVSEAFRGQTPVQRHSAVYAALGDAMRIGDPRARAEDADAGGVGAASETSIGVRRG